MTGANREALMLMVEKGEHGSATGGHNTQSLTSQLFPLLIEEQMLLENHGPEHPKLKAIQRRIAATRRYFQTTAVENDNRNGTAKPVDFLLVYVQSLQEELMAKWVGEESGLRGILIGTLAGGFMPGGPYVSLPLAAGFLRAGAGIGTMVAFITAWSLWAVARIPMEVGIIGWRFTLIRLACTFFFPPIAGLLARFFFSGFK